MKVVPVLAIAAAVSLGALAWWHQHDAPQGAPAKSRAEANGTMLTGAARLASVAVGTARDLLSLHPMEVHGRC